ncbi:hypothetical protein COW36_01855 [bacterium (Candidatus Blackallbacteria) CG17_big_fil_post_rev_8_21_14_2_50_48_46]|uniref:Uncharacterized protein n=1 Tax=bacterium (Candidatus Blackallbacteria) CG17_big_fil_post_rev_8_21_14_2_50_48_46 TaxID=2014261 RepID=A0A2M7GAK2_9BACT|nr:MAG: hypothetical protein COW64_26245 [bacterium (Candidatus Blackallbacteria) CG18_big_fil_WC_8_21_14_2_50_49_26]PIW19181.1 MAG: hypothetical protein COW36_01855 [bacterium (Candidatus Blackallbacteria) CG17_big_fil_post_rev_8_21_14_2_50_48_46]PIW45469.1 MAG: hypothetical protein COW20_20285 [bacterium (Candidatus Blackallbacteria) CG13_big_fil_rev_8_21_14_2_50_49_14]
MKILWGPDFREPLDLSFSEVLKAQGSKFDYDPEHIPPGEFLPAWERLIHRDHSPPDWFFVLNPLKRLAPPQIGKISLPVLAVCDFSGQMHPPFLAKCLADYDALLAVNPQTQAQLKAAGLKPLDTLWMGILPRMHKPLTSPQVLFPLLYYAQNGHSPLLSELEALDLPIKPHYFIATHPAILPFYFKHSRYVILDDPFLNTRHLEALASGAILLCPETNTEIQNFLVPDQDFICFNPQNLSQKLLRLEENPELRLQLQTQARERLKEYDYFLIWNKLKTELHSIQPQNKVAERFNALAQNSNQALISEIYCTSLAENPIGLNLMPELVKKAPTPVQEALCHILINTYIQVALHPLSSGNSKVYFELAQNYLASLPESPQKNRQLLYLAWKQNNPAQTLEWLKKSRELPLEDAEVLSLPLALFNDSLYKELQNWWSPQHALELVCAQIELSCLESLQAWESLLERSEFWIVRAPLALFHRAKMNALSALNQNNKVLEAFEQALQDCPLEVGLWVQYAAFLGASHPEQAFKILSQGREINLRMPLFLENIEVFHALERMIWKAHPALKQESSRSYYILWEGAVQAHHSLARINRYLISELEKKPELYLTLLPIHPPEFFEAHPPGDRSNHLQEPDLVISHRWPPRLQAPQQGKWINILPWEHGVLPSEWIHTLNTQMDQVWVPSQFVATSFVHSGVNAERIRVIPNGTQPEIYCPEGPIWKLETEKTLKFLFIGGMIPRKGVDILLKAYAKAFSRKDDVALVIKSFGDQGVYSSGSMAEELRYFQENPEAPELIFINRSDLSEAELASLYRACQVYVHPYRGEGFGLPILEAMACGLPVVVPESGPAPEFSTSDSAWYLPTWVSFEQAKNIGNLGATPFLPYYQEVDGDALADCLRSIAQSPELIPSKAKAAEREAKNFSWQTMASNTWQAIQACSDKKTPLRFQVPQALNQWHQALQSNDWPEPESLALPSPLENFLPYLQHFLRKALNSQNTNYFKRSLRQALKAGLGLNDYLRLELPTLKDLSPLRIHWPESIFEPALCFQQHPLFQPVQTPGKANLIITQNPSIFSQETIFWAEQGTEALPSPDQVAAVWYGHPLQKSELKSLGWSEENIHFLPPGLDFEFFHPQNSPHQLEESLGRFCFMAFPDFQKDQSWKQLIKAYCEAFQEDSPVNLVMKPLGISFDAAIEEVTDWLQTENLDPETIPSLTFIQEDLTRQNLQGLFTASQVFIELQAGNSLWALAAQASGCRVFSKGQAPHLEAPFAEVLAEHSVSGLAWRMKKAVEVHKDFNGFAIREYLEQSYSHTLWKRKLDQLLGQILLKRQWGL